MLPQKYIWILLVSSMCMACQPTPQKVRYLNQEETVDETLLAQMQFNSRMVSEADQICQALVKSDNMSYTLDEYGFWYRKTIVQGGDTLQKGEEIELHIQISDTKERLLLDTKKTHALGSGDLPISINRALTQMCPGEQMRIITPWYAAYGVEGTSIIKPYSNLIILLTIEQ